MKTTSLTETDTAGTSTTRVFTGQTVSRNGGPSATTGHSVSVSPPLGFVTAPGPITFTDTLNGKDQVASASLPLDIASGPENGWSLSATSTTFGASGGKTLANNSVTVPLAPTRVCDTTCTLATTNVSYPYTLPAGTTAPPATKLFNALPGTGDTQTVTPIFNLAVPANTRAGHYTSTWTLTLQSGP